MKLPKGGEKGGRKVISGLRKMDICPQCREEHKIQRGSILKIGMKFSKKKTNGKMAENLTLWEGAGWIRAGRAC